MSLFAAIAEAVGLQANQSRFRFRIAGDEETGLRVKAFSGSGHGLSDDFLFQVHCVAAAPKEPAALVGKSACLDIAGARSTACIHGLLSEFTWAGNNADGAQFVASLASPLHPLKLRRNNRVFLNVTIPQIIEEVLTGAGLGCDFAWELREDYPIREFTVQYHESDWDFLLRLAAGAGLFFRWDMSPEGARLVFHDGLEHLPQIPAGALLYEVQSGTSRSRETIFSLQAHTRLLSADTELRDYNYRTPEFLLDAQGAGATTVFSHGSLYRYGDHHKDLPQAQQLARRRQQALDWQRELYLADSDCPALFPGGRLTLDGHPDPARNCDYLILAVEHQADQSGGLSYGGSQNAMSYRNRLTLIPFGIPYAPPLPEQRPMHGVFTARVESSGGPYACLDEQGRYRIRLHFDDGQAAPGAASHAVRLMQPYSGDNYGLHFPLHPGTEVALACVNGDLDRPILLGALPNPETLGPVTAANPSQNILRTFGGHELLLEDRKGEERIELFTRERKNLLKLDAGSAGHKVRLATTEGSMEVQAAKSLHLESGDTHSTISGKDHLITVENSQQLATQKADIELHAATDIRMKAAGKLALHAEQQDIQLKAAKNMVLQAGEGMTVEVRNRNLTLRATGGQLSIEAAKTINILGQGGGAITIGQSGGTVTIAADGAVTISSHTVNVIGKSVNVQGVRNAQGGGGGGGGGKVVSGPARTISETLRSATEKAPPVSDRPSPMPKNLKTSVPSAGNRCNSIKEVRKIRIQEISGPTEGRKGDNLIYTVTRFNYKDISSEEKKKVCWLVKIDGKIIDKFENVGDKLKYKTNLDINYTNIHVYAYVNEPSEMVKQVTRFDDRMKTSQIGIDFIKKHEALRLKMYNDANGHATIGYGHLVHKGPINGSEPLELRNGITSEKAEELLRNDIKIAENAVIKYTKVALSQSQFDALVSFCFNVGTGNFYSSTLLKYLNNKNYSLAEKEFHKWVYGTSIGEKFILKGLVNRRAAEAEMFNEHN